MFKDFYWRMARRAYVGPVPEDVDCGRSNAFYLRCGYQHYHEMTTHVSSALDSVVRAGRNGVDITESYPRMLDTYMLMANYELRYGMELLEVELTWLERTLGITDA